MLEINKKLISYNYTKGVTISPRYIVVHDTDNTDSGANADAHYRYFGGGDRGASAHYFVDDSNIIQILEDTWRGWHCGDRYNETVNNGNSIGVETCINSDGDYDKALNNTIDLVEYLMKKWNIPIENVVRHYDITGKYCPRRIMDSGSWDWFKSQLKTGSVIYQAHIQNIGWQEKKRDGGTAGTTGEGLRLEALTIKTEDVEEELEFYGHIQDKGWTSMRTTGEIIGTIGESLRLEAIKLQFKNNSRNIAYRVHIENIGWTDWKYNGDIAGTTGEGLRIEAIEIHL